MATKKSSKSKQKPAEAPKAQVKAPEKPAAAAPAPAAAATKAPAAKVPVKEAPPKVVGKKPAEKPAMKAEPKAAPAAAPAPAKTITRGELERRVREEAYRRAAARNFRNGSPVADWLAAERAVLGQLSADGVTVAQG